MKNTEQLWAPWRLAYITGGQEKNEANPQRVLPGGDSACFLCQAATGGDDRCRLVVQHGRYSLTVLNRYPYNNGHLLVAPVRHVARLDDLSQEESFEVAQTITRMVGVLEQTIRAEGFNVGLNLGQVAGAGLPGHVHWHIVPRWSGDTNFMPTTAGIRVIPQSLEALWELLATRCTSSGTGTNQHDIRIPLSAGTSMAGRRRHDRPAIPVSDVRRILSHSAARSKQPRQRRVSGIGNMADFQFADGRGLRDGERRCGRRWNGTRTSGYAAARCPAANSAGVGGAGDAAAIAR